MIHGDLCHHESSFFPDISSISTLSTTTTRRDCMNSTRPLSHGLMLGLCVLVGSLFTVGVRASSAFADPQPNPNRTTVLSDLPQNWSKKLPSASRFTVLSTFADAAVQKEETRAVGGKTLGKNQHAVADARCAR